MNLRYVSEFKYDQKVFSLYQDQNNKEYIKKVTDLYNYHLLKKIADVASENENLNSIGAFYKTNNNKLFYFVELIDGVTLTNYLEKNLLNIDNAKNIIYQLCLAVKMLHSNKILHRDIKPDNIMIKDNMSVVLIDYDITRIYQEKKESDTILSGTRGYAAPEQFGFSQTTIKSDIYSLGMTIHEIIKCLSNQEKIFFNHLYEKAVMLDPSKRFESVDEMLLIINNNDTVFFDVQLEQINKGKSLNLSEEQILIYAKPFYSANQMGVIKHALNEGVSDEVIKIMSDSSFNSKQMWQIKRGFLDGLSKKDILKYAKPIYREEEMSLYRSGLTLSYSDDVIFENIKLYSELLRSCNFNSEQLTIIRRGFYKGLDYQSILPICFDIEVEKMEKILSILVS